MIHLVQRLPLAARRPLVLHTAFNPSKTITRNLASSSVCAQDARNTGKVKKVVSSILLGDPNTGPIASHSESTWSSVLGGKHALYLKLEHNVRPECRQEYVELLRSHYIEMQHNLNDQIRLVASFEPFIGCLDKFVHIWELDDYASLDKVSGKLHNDPTHQKYLKNLYSFVQSRESSVMLTFEFWPEILEQYDVKTVNEGQLGSIYEIRTYQLKPGCLLEWAEHWQRGVQCRLKHCTPVGAWFSQLGQLNTVTHIWVYKDLASRKIAREQAWQEDGWANTVQKTTRLVNEMRTDVMLGCNWSPLR